jgi:hypothetical protein
MAVCKVKLGLHFRSAAPLVVAAETSTRKAWDGRRVHHSLVTGLDLLLTQYGRAKLESVRLTRMIGRAIKSALPIHNANRKDAWQACWLALP